MFSLPGDIHVGQKWRTLPVRRHNLLKANQGAIGSFQQEKFKPLLCMELRKVCGCYVRTVIKGFVPAELVYSDRPGALGSDSFPLLSHNHSDRTSHCLFYLAHPPFLVQLVMRRPVVR